MKKTLNIFSIIIILICVESLFRVGYNIYPVMIIALQATSLLIANIPVKK